MACRYKSFVIIFSPPEIRMNSYIIKKPGRGSYQTATAPRLSHGG